MTKIINFSENRNVYMPNNQMKKSLLKAQRKVFEYPDYKNTEVNRCISEYFGIEEKNLTVTNGSLEGINLLVCALNKTETVLFVPTFWGYADALNRFNYIVKNETLVDELNYDYDRVSEIAKLYKIMILCNPNNPTLSYIPKKVLLSIIKENPHCHFIIDETMLIFDEKYENKSVSNEVENFENLSVVVSFSKFLGIAGLRTGAVFSNKTMIEKVKKLSIPYSLGVIQQNILPVAFADPNYLDETRKLITKNREYLCDNLQQLGCNVIDGNTNFILVKLPDNVDSTAVAKYLYQNGIEVRNIKEAYPKLKGNWIRISIQTQKNNELLVKKMQRYIKCK